MIQRIQSVWLFIASLVAFFTLKLSFFSGTHMPDHQYHQLKGIDTGLLLDHYIVLGIVTLFTIFLYKKKDSTTAAMHFGNCPGSVIALFVLQRSSANFSQGTYSITAAMHLVIISFFIF
jgi:hypothetical protein